MATSTVFPTITSIASEGDSVTIFLLAKAVLGTIKLVLNCMLSAMSSDTPIIHLAHLGEQSSFIRQTIF
jgi:hypothetical protein